MSVAPRVATPSQRVNGYTVLVDEGAQDGLSEGDDVMLSVGDEYVRSTVVDVSETQSVVEITTT